MNKADHAVNVPRTRILDAAFSVLAREGPPSPAAVAREAGVSKALVFHHFRSVEGLYDAMAERVLAQTQEGLDAFATEFPNPRERLHALVRALLSEPPEPPQSARHVLRFWLDDDGRGGSRATLRDALLADFVRATLKEMRSSTEPAGVASMMLARWHGATVVYASGTPIDFDAEAERAIAELDRLTGARP